MSLLIAGMGCGVAMAAAPTLSVDGVSPSSGTPSTDFTFSVTYGDADGDLPSSIDVVINGTSYGMTESDASDTDVTDGKGYTYTMGGFPVATHNFQFTASDGTESATPTSLKTFDVSSGNTAPTLSGDGVSPSSGTPSTDFTFSVTYGDADGDLPSSIDVVINGTSYSMTESDAGDTDVTDGKDYSYTMGSFPVATHNFQFTASDGTDTATPTSLKTFDVSSGNTAPVLSGDDVSPSSGTPSTDFTFTVTYEDADGDLPSSIDVVINGTSYGMTESDAGDADVTDGKDYSYTMGGFPVATHNFRFTASDGTDSATPTSLKTFLVDVADHAPTFEDESVSGIPDESVGSTFFFNITYVDSDNDEADYVRVVIDGDDHTMTKMDNNDPEDGILYSYNTSSLGIGDHDYYFEASDGTNPINTDTSTVTVQIANYNSGDRIWDADADQSLDYTWNALSYSGFYYDLESGLGSETMTIHLDSDSDRNIGDGDLKYSTTPISTDFEHGAWGSYEIIGFMAERYFAGYTDDTDNDITFDEISMMSRGQLSKVLIDSDDKESVFTGAGLVLEDGYVLNIIEVDVNGDRVFVRLSKDGSEVDETVLSSRDTYTYEVDLGDVDDVPIIAVYFDEIFSGIETNAVFIEGIFQISDDYVEVESGDGFGAMEVKSISSTEIRMENEDSLDLDEGDIVDIMGKLKFIVADDNTLRFAPFVDMSEPGTYELRGTIAENEGFNWTPLNFEGFYYNIDEGIGTESLSIVYLDGRSIGEDDLVYTTSPDEVSFERDEWGKYEVIGFMAEKYFAGYPDDAFEDGRDSVSMMSRGQLSKVLIDEDDKKSVYGGSSIILEEGYSLEIVEVDVNGDRVLVELLKDGDSVDSDVLSSRTPYIYETDLGDVDDVPIIAVNFREVFSGTESTAVFIEGIFQISDEYIEIESGDDFGEMEVKTISSEKIEMRNPDDISLSRDDEVEIMGDISFKVADSSDVRYYPFVEVTVEPDEALDVEVDPEVVVEGDEVVITVTSRGSLINDVTVKAGSLTLGTTDNEGVVEYKFSSDGTYKITAEKDGYATGTAEVEVISPDDLSRKMSIEVIPEVIYEGNLVTFTVVKAIGGDPMEDVRISLDGKTIGQTGSDGVVTDVITEPGMHKIVAEKSGFLKSELNIEVIEMQAKFEFSDLVLDPIEVKSGKDVEITLNAVNNGNAEGSYTVELMVNNNVTDTREITLGVNESTEVSFEYEAGEPGSYLVKVGGMTATLEVVEGVSTIVYVLGGLAVIILGGAVYLFTAGGWTVETAGPKASEAMAALSEKISNLLSRGKE
ncbi:S-layer protein domain-containing protein [Methanococcoides sp. FTZ1]|uniref:S-layer protein domain-containing protein n=1 Tax=Methanococcoides sp. FTZ1 TaxID=3439061 RepID=UPI003F830F38